MATISGWAGLGLGRARTLWACVPTPSEGSPFRTVERTNSGFAVSLEVDALSPESRQEWSRQRKSRPSRTWEAPGLTLATALRMT